MDFKGKQRALGEQSLCEPRIQDASPGDHDARVGQLGDALLASKAVEHDADLLFGSKPAARLPSDLAHCCFARLLLSCRHNDALLGGEISAMCLLVQITRLSESLRRKTVAIG